MLPTYRILDRGDETVFYRHGIEAQEGEEYVLVQQGEVCDLEHASW